MGENSGILTAGSQEKNPAILIRMARHRRRTHKRRRIIRRKQTKRSRRHSRRQRGGTLAFLDLPENRQPTLAVGLQENPEGEYDNPDNVPTVHRATL